MSKKVLIVEDADDVRVMMKILIETQGYEAIMARDGYEAVMMAREYRPDLILMDLMMPIMDGFTATTLIRQDKELARIPIVAVTAYGDTCLEKALEIGFDNFIAKPIDFENLKPLLHYYSSS